MWGLALLFVVPQGQSLPAEIAEPLRKYVANTRELLPEKQINTGTMSGFSITVRNPFYRTDGTGQGGRQSPSKSTEKAAPPVPSGYDHEQIIVVPAGKEKAPNVAKLPWEAQHQTYYRERIYLGKARGHHWYGDMPLWAARRLVKEAGLLGGPDPIDLAMRELEIDDQGQMTSNSGIYFLADHADKAMPKLKAAIFSKTRKYPDRAIRPLQGSRSKASTALLMQVYRSKNDKLKGTAAYILIHKPYRKDAKAAYLDMISQRRSHIQPAAEAAVEFGWKEAAKPLLESMPRVPSAWQFAEIFLLARKLIGADTPADVELIRRGPWTADKVEKAKSALLSWPDREAAAVVAFSMTCLATKADVDATNKAGKEVLLALPPEVTKKFLRAVVRDLPNDQERKFAQKLLWEIP